MTEILPATDEEIERWGKVLWADDSILRLLARICAEQAKNITAEPVGDMRPHNCRFRLQDEGKAYPRSSCSACKKTIMTGLDKNCTHPTPAPSTEQKGEAVAHPLASWPDGLPLGLYVIHWKSGGSSEAAIGMQSDGTRWIAPTNWTSPGMRSDASEWCAIDRVERITHPSTARADAIRECIAVVEKQFDWSLTTSEVELLSRCRKALRALLEREEG